MERSAVAAFALLVGIVASGPASAQESGESSGNVLTIGIGGKGGALFGGALGVPDEGTDQTGLYGNMQGRWGAGTDPELYGMFGGGGGGGPVLDIRYNKLIGLQAGVYFTNDTYSGENDIERKRTGRYLGSITQTQTTTATHIPVLLKVSPSFTYVRPVFGVGVEFVSQNKAELSYTSDDFPGRVDELNAHNEGEPANYTMFQFTAGMEIDAGPLRIPIEFRGGYNLGWKNTYEARATKKPNKQVYRGAYMGHFGVFAGVLYRWEIEL